MQPHPSQYPGVQILATGDMPNDLCLHSGLASVFQNAQHLLIGNIDVIDQQLSFGALKESCKALSGVDWTDHQLVAARGEGLALDVGVKELGSFKIGRASCRERV